ncbi:MAG: flavin reductase family protein [Dehalococcoidia bacterium]|nr:flavin reductase family protein [Dehalococcoidia bacterium]
MSSEDTVQRAKYEPLRQASPEPVSEALETMPYGLYIVGSRSERDELNGMMADWLMQVSFKPRLLLCSMENDATTLKNVRATGVFSVNVLPEDARELAAHFAQPRDASKVKGRSEEASAVVYDKLAGLAYSRGERTDCPILEDALAWLECQAEQFVEAGDHTLVIARVLEGDVLREGEPLTQRALGWSYGG